MTTTTTPATTATTATAGPRSAINWFEIPAVDLDRAVRFWETVLGKPLRRETFQGTAMAVFSYDRPGVGGAVLHSPTLRPSTDGPLLYLDSAGPIAACVGRVERAGGRVILERTSIGPMGFIAIIADTEGNRIGLHGME